MRLSLGVDIGQRFAALVGQDKAAFHARRDMRLFAEEQLDVGFDGGGRICGQGAQGFHTAAQEQHFLALVGQLHLAVALILDQLDSRQTLGVAADAGVDLVVRGAAADKVERVVFVGSQFFILHCSNIQVSQAAHMVTAQPVRGKPKRRACLAEGPQRQPGQADTEAGAEHQRHAPARRFQHRCAAEVDFVV